MAIPWYMLQSRTLLLENGFRDYTPAIDSNRPGQSLRICTGLTHPESIEFFGDLRPPLQRCKTVSRAIPALHHPSSEL